jgi:hypothetical protein
MDVPRLSLALCAIAIIALVAAVWLIGFDESGDVDRRLQQTKASRTNPERARVRKPRESVPSGEGRIPSESDADASNAGGSLQQASPGQAASAPASDGVAGAFSDGAREAGRASTPAMTASEIERRWRSRDPDDQEAAIDALNALPDRMLAVDVVQQMITREPLRSNDPAWDALDGLDRKLKVDAVAGMLFGPEPGRSAAIRTLAGDRWQHGEQMLSELFGTTEANYQDHGDLIANGIQDVGEGGRAASILRELKWEIRSSD